MAGADQNSLWDAPDPNADGVQRLSRMVAGNDNLITEPGLVQALYENNATPEQAAAIDQFLSGLNAEKTVRTAAAAGHQIYLDPVQQEALTAMGIPFQSVLKSPQDQLSQLRQQMAAKGLQPVTDAAGQVQTDGNGNPIVKPLAGEQMKSGLTDKAHLSGDAANALGWFVAQTQGKGLDIANIGEDIAGLGGASVSGATGLANAANEAWNWVDTKVSRGINSFYGGTANAISQGETASVESAKQGGAPVHVKDTTNQAMDQQNAELMRQLGYDPTSWFSRQAFDAKGYAHDDLSSLIDAWDQAHPDGKFGWNGDQAVTAAALYAADPAKYNEHIIKNSPPDTVAAQLQAVSTPEFQDLVKRVNAGRTDIGANVASGIGIDPVKHPTLFASTSAAANLATSFVLDPTSIALSGYSAVQRSAVALKSLSDTEGLVKILRPAEGAFVPASQRKAIGLVQDMVDTANKIRATADPVELAKLHAGLQARNPLYGLIGDFTGEDQILRTMTDAESASREISQLPFITGKAEPLDTYEKAVDYFGSWNALERLQGGMAPIESTVMPGALSNAAYLRVKGGLAAWSAGRSAVKDAKAASKFIFSQTADPEKFKTLIDDRFLTRVLATPGDAVDVLSGKVLSAQEKVAQATGDELPAAQAELASARRALADSVTLTDQGAGTLRNRQLAFGNIGGKLTPGVVQNALDRQAAATTSIPGAIKAGNYGTAARMVGDQLVAMGYGTLGMWQRAKLLARRGPWAQLPRDTEIDFTSAASADTIRKMARTYLTPGHTAMLMARYMHGDAETRKTIFEGLSQQIYHAAGLTRTQAGREIIDRAMAQKQKYAILTDDILDANGTPMGLVPGHMVLKRRLPNFGAIHKSAAKVGLYEATIGRILTSTPMDRLVTGAWKMPILAVPVTAVRAIIEPFLDTLFERDSLFLDAIRAKAIRRNAGKMNFKEIARSAPVEKLLSLTPFRDAARVYEHVLKTGMEKDYGEAVLKLPDDLEQRYIHEQLAGHFAMTMDPGGTQEITEIAQNGFRVVKASYDKPEHVDAIAKRLEGYETTDEVDGVAGVNLYAHNLGLYVNRAPEVAKAIIRALRDPNIDGPAEVAKALESGAARRWMIHSGFGKKVLNDHGKWVDAVTPAEAALGKKQWADKVITEFKELTTGRNGVLQKDIHDYVLKHGKSPDPDWLLAHVKGQNRPQTLLKPVYHAVAQPSRAGGLADAFIDTEGKLYKWLVERLIQRHATTPLFAAAYGRAKVGLEDFKQLLIEHGMGEEAAERATQDAAAHRAWQRIARMVDDPHLKSQLDVVGRGFFAFSRATTMMLRRWGSTFWRNPVAARRMQLAAEAAVHAGVVHKDPTTGEWMFSFPASGVAQEVILHAMSHIPGLEGLAQFPVSDFEGRVASIIPGSNNPTQYSTTPMVSIAGRWLAGFFPEYRGFFDKADAALNGSMGQGQSAWATIEPSLWKRIVEDPGWGISSDDARGAMVASSMIGALYYLYAAGHVPPEGASDVEFRNFLGRLKTHQKWVLTLRGLLGSVSPASISSPDSAEGLGPADAAFIAAGISNLKDEYRTIVNDTGGDFARANAIWVALHPDEGIFSQSMSQSTTKHANMPLTADALGWMEKNAGFIGKYQSVAAYFMPEKGGPYDSATYRAQLEEGLRQYKTPMEFLKGLYYSQDASVYYPMEDQYKADVANAKAAGNTDLVSQYNADWKAWSENFKTKHPIFAKQLVAYGADSLSADTQLGDLESMVKNGDVPGGPTVTEAVKGMIQAWKGYKAFRQDHPAGTNLNDAARQAAFQQLQDYLQGVVKVVPELTDLYNGVFRGLDNYLTPIDTTTGGTTG